MKIPRDSAFAIAVFFVFLVACTAVGYWLIFRLGRATPIMLAVGFATVLTCLFAKRDLAAFGWGWGRWKYQWISYVLPLFIALAAYSVIWATGSGDWYDHGFVQQKMEDYNLVGWNERSVIAFHIGLSASYGILLLLPSVLGEEMGWRGFLVPELARFMSFGGVALTSGFIWAVWHWPMIFMGIYGNEGPPLLYQLFFFTVLLTAISVIMTYLRLRSGSLWTAVVFHMSFNVFMQKIFAPLTAVNDRSAWFVNEFGAIPALVASGIAIYFWIKGRKEFGDLGDWRRSAVE